MKSHQKNNVQKVILVISDLHLSAGKMIKGKRNFLEDFHYDNELIDFLKYYCSGDYENIPVELVINGDFLARLPVADSPRDHIYVIDPFGNLMMRFPRNVDPQRMKKDVEKLMKNSSGWIRTAK